MSYDIRPLSPELLEDYLRFFDNEAFSDHQEWSGCYCTYFHLGRQDEKRIEAEHHGEPIGSILRRIAIGMINEGRLCGYLAYCDGKVVGWCNTAAKRNCKKLCENQEIWDEGEDMAVKSVTCFVVDPQARRKGVAAALLNRALRNAGEEGYSVMEAYPATGDLDCFSHYHGHPEMYEKAGFFRHKALEGACVYRKLL